MLMRGKTAESGTWAIHYFVRPIDNARTKTYHTDDGDRVIPGNQIELIDGCFNI